MTSLVKEHNQIIRDVVRVDVNVISDEFLLPKDHLSTDSTKPPLAPRSNYIFHLAAGEQRLNNE